MDNKISSMVRYLLIGSYSKILRKKSKIVVSSLPDNNNSKLCVTTGAWFLPRESSWELNTVLKIELYKKKQYGIQSNGFFMENSKM